MSHANLKIQKGENLDEVRRETLAKVYELILALPINNDAGPYVDDDKDRLLTERVSLPRSERIIPEIQRG